MSRSNAAARVRIALAVLLTGYAIDLIAQPHWPARFVPERSSSSLKRGLTSGAFFDVVGRRSAAFGYEGRPLEAWVYPLKVLDNLQLSFRIEGYPLAISTSDLPGTIEVRPEATIFTFSHAAYTVRQIVFAPIDEPAVVVLLDIDTTLPLEVIGQFRPVLRPMWPAGAPTPGASWDATAQMYEIAEDSGRYAAIVGIPGGSDRSLMPYQEEPRDVPVEFSIAVDPGRAARELVPIVITGDVTGRDGARAAYARVAGNLERVYRTTTGHYARLIDESAQVTTGEPRLDRAFDWARVGMDKGMATNPMLGTGLVAGFRTSGNSERPGFAWFFGRDAMWTSLALTASSRVADAHTALAFLASHQREDGKVPHEISQSARLVDWFKDYPYAWASADATPLYVIAHADAWRAGGDRSFLATYWPSIRKAYQFSAGTDADRNHLIENTNVGHGWVEGGALYPPHEEIYLQGLWIEASRSFAEMAVEMGDAAAGDAARAAAERTRAAVEQTYWLADRSHYAFATRQPRTQPAVAEPGPNRERRQRRLDEIAAQPLIDEDTVLPAVPMWWRALDPARADAAIDRIGGGALATDWGQRILSNQSLLYDPLSYHYGSVWPLFTGWASMAAYRYGRPHVGYQALMANALLTEPGALGFVTELLSGDRNAPFGRSSHHQIWSEAMIAAPLVRGLLGIEPLDGGKRLRIAPQMPADWSRAEARHVLCGGVSFDVAVTRAPGALRLHVRRAPGATGASPSLVIAPALPLDAQLSAVSVNGTRVRPQIARLGDVQFVEVGVASPPAETVVEVRYRGGSDVYLRTPAPATGARSEGVRILRSRADAGALTLLVEGLSSHSYDLFLRTSRQINSLKGGTLVPQPSGDPIVRVTFEGEAGQYSRREVVVSMR